MTQISEKTIPEKDDQVPLWRNPRWEPVLRIAKRIGYRIYRLSGEFCAIILGTALIWFGVLNIVAAKRTIDVSYLSENVGIWFANAFDGNAADIERLNLSWIPSENVIELFAENTIIKGKSGETLQTLYETRVAADFSKLLTGKVDTRSAEIDGGALTWVRDQSGGITIGIGTPDTYGTFAPLVSPETTNPGDVTPGFGSLEHLKFRNGRIFIVDHQNSIKLTLVNANVDVEREQGTIRFEFESRIESENTAVGEFTGGFEISENLETIVGGILIGGLVPADIAPDQGPLAAMSSIAAPLTANVSINKTPDLNDRQIVAELGEGTLTLGPITERITSARATIRQDDNSANINIENVEINGRRIQAVGAADISQNDSNFTYDLHLDQLDLDLTNLFDDVFTLKDIRIAGEFNPEPMIFRAADLAVDFGPFRITGDLDIDLGEAGIEAIQSDGRIIGTFTQKELLSLWPTEFALGARNWIERAILAGDLYDMAFSVDIPAEAIQNRALDDEYISLTYGARDAEVRYISTMTPLTNVSGRGRLQGNRMDFDVDYAEVGQLVVEKGRIEIPRLNPKGGDFTIEVTGNGPVLEMMNLIDQKPFEFASRYGVDPNAFGGSGRINMKITRPLLEFFDPSRIRYEVDGLLSEVVAPFAFGGQSITDGSVLLTANGEGMTLKGPVSIGDWDVDLNWREEFGDNRGPTQIHLEGMLDRDALDGFGIGLREFIGGSTKVTIQAEGQGMDVQKARVEADLSQSDLQIGEYWSKPAGTDGYLNANINREIKDLAVIDNIEIGAPGLNLTGSVTLNDALQLQEVAIPNVEVAGFVDGSVSARPVEERSRIAIEMSGRFLDLSPFVSRAVRAQPSEFTLPMRINADVETMTLGPDYNLDGAKLVYEHSGIGVENLSLTGTTMGETLVAKLTKMGDDKGRLLNIQVPNAAKAAASFFGLSNIENGQLRVSGSLPEVGETGRMSGEVQVDDFKLINAPVFARMLSMASLKGLTDLMGGSGVHFDQLSVPFTFEAGELRIREATAAGAALGMTGDGDINFPNQTVDIDGVLVPAYTANSALASIPVIGDIFVGKKGEGIFALSYGVKGGFKQTQISVNPLSALTPGFLRQIFDPVRDKDDVAEQPVADDESNPPNE